MTAPQRRKKTTRAAAAAPAAAAAAPATPAPSGDGRTMRLAKQATVIVGLISGTVGLLFLFVPSLRPGGGSGPPQSARITGVKLNPRTTQGQFLDYSDKSKLGFTRQQLAIVGASIFARIEINGYRHKSLILERQLVDATTNNVVGRTRDYAVKPPNDQVTSRWTDWTPLRPGPRSYVLVLKVYDARTHLAIACGQTDPFGGLTAKTITPTPPQICEDDG
jgi:hypothetical protein